MKKITLITILSVLITSAFAQDFQKYKIAPMVGAGIGWLNPDSKFITNEGSMFRFGYGLAVDIHFTENYAIGTGLNVSNFGGNLSFKESGRVNNVQSIWQTTREFDLRYVEIPLSLKLRTNEIGYMTYWGQFGLIAGVNIRARGNSEIDYESSKIETDSGVNWIKSDLPSLTSEDDDIKDDTQIFRVGLLIGAGIEYGLSGNSAVVVGVSYNNGFTNVLKGEVVQTDDRDEVVFESQNPKTSKLKAMSHIVSLNVGFKF